VHIVEVNEMDLAKISLKGQVTIPVGIRRKLGLKEGDKVVFVEKGDNVIILNSNKLAFEEFRRDMAGVTESSGLKTEQDVVDVVREVRRKIWDEKYEGNA
jgi:AbrB family looped-hinge helix DNA binding protein